MSGDTFQALKGMTMTNGVVLINGIQLVGTKGIEITEIDELERTDENDRFIYIQLEGDSFAGYFYNSEKAECIFEKESDDIYSLKILPKTLE